MLKNVIPKPKLRRPFDCSLGSTIICESFSSTTTFMNAAEFLFVLVRICQPSMRFANSTVVFICILFSRICLSTCADVIPELMRLHRIQRTLFIKYQVFSSTDKHDFESKRLLSILIPRVLQFSGVMISSLQSISVRPPTNTKALRTSNVNLSVGCVAYLIDSALVCHCLRHSS